MRISTNMQYKNGLSYIQDSNSKLDILQRRAYDGKKFQTAGDDPSGMANYVKYTGAIAAFTQYSKDGGIAANTLAEEETALKSMWDALSSINTRLQQCVDGTNDQNNLNALAEDILQTRDQLFDLMNTKNTDGEYIFSGARSDVPTYSLTSDGHYSCQADGSTRSVLVSPNVTVQVSDSGLNIFENCKTANSMNVTATPAITTSLISNSGDFGDLYTQYYSSAVSAVNNLTLDVAADGTFSIKDPAGNEIGTGEMDKNNSTITYKGMEFILPDSNYTGTINIELEAPKTDNILNILTDTVAKIKDENISSADKSAIIAESQKDVLLAMDHYDSYRGKVGARQNVIDNVISSNTSLSDIKTESRAKVSEVDTFENTSALAQAKNQLEISRQTYSMLSKQSLFNYI